MLVVSNLTGIKEQLQTCGESFFQFYSRRKLPAPPAILLKHTTCQKWLQISFKTTKCFLLLFPSYLEKLLFLSFLSFGLFLFVSIYYVWGFHFRHPSRNVASPSGALKLFPGDRVILSEQSICTAWGKGIFLTETVTKDLLSGSVAALQIFSSRLSADGFRC